ncbi:hypothetical protein J3F83DRAFT_731328 [Trichoderma novae-zelandiae]
MPCRLFCARIDLRFRESCTARIGESLVVCLASLFAIVPLSTEKGRHVKSHKIQQFVMFVAYLTPATVCPIMSLCPVS